MKVDGAVDYDGFRELIESQIQGGISGLVPLGSTGESPVLDDDEKETLIRTIVAAVHGRLPVIVGTGSNSTRIAVAYTRRAKELGADAALVVTPYYNKPNDEGLLRHFETIAKEGLPLLIYNIASRTGRNIDAGLMERLAAIPGIIGVKESSGDLNQMGDIIKHTALKRRAAGKDFSVLSGDDGLTLPLLALGGDGIISVVSNLVPARVAALTKAGLDGDFEQARRIHYELLPLIKAVFVETNPIPIKAALTLAGKPAGPTRLPLGALSKSNEALLRQVMTDMGIV
jgi:4-hydroxy-tetrahydrodipicolinate synthase